MQDQEFQNMLELENTYWWFVGRRFIIENLMKMVPETYQILDLGAGVGSNIPILSEFGKVTAIDPSDKASELAKTRGYTIEKGDASNLEEYRNYNLVTTFDVLEHIEDDTGALRNIHKSLSENGHLLLSVPAFPILWSEHDHALGHFRRYSKKDLLKKIQTAGFEPVKVTFSVSFVFPVLLIYRFLTKSGKRQQASYISLPKPINNALINMLRIEAMIIKRLNLPIGSSLFVLAKKSDIAIP